jgi:tRNA-binding protein
MTSRMAITIEPGPRMIEYGDFETVEMRVGRIVRAEAFPEARRPAVKLWIDFGELGVKRSSAQITAYYRLDELVGRQVIAVTNFPPKQIASFLSEVLVLGVPKEGEVVLLGPDQPVPSGGRVY